MKNKHIYVKLEKKFLLLCFCFHEGTGAIYVIFIFFQPPCNPEFLWPMNLPDNNECRIIECKKKCVQYNNCTYA